MSDTKPGDAKTSPFGNGKGAAMGGANGGRDFTKENRASNGGEGASGDASSGGRDFTKENRPQTEAKAEVVPNKEEIPAGGKIPLANAMSVSAKVSGTAATGPNERKPFKLKG